MAPALHFTPYPSLKFRPDVFILRKRSICLPGVQSSGPQSCRAATTADCFSLTGLRKRLDYSTAPWRQRIRIVVNPATSCLL